MLRAAFLEDIMKIAASIMCANQLALKEELEKLEKANVDILHCDVMDGIFVNNLAMGPYVLEYIKKETSIPLDIHLATIDPGKYIEMYSHIKPEYISFHFEASDNVERDIQMIKDAGIKVSIAISPQTPVEVLEKYLDKIDMILMMTVNPGFAGQKFNMGVLKKLDKLKKMTAHIDKRPIVEVDGNINPDTIAMMDRDIVDVYVLGTSALFREDGKTYSEKVDIIKSAVMK